MPSVQCVVRITRCVCVYHSHCWSAWLPPADTPFILQAQDVRKCLSQDFCFKDLVSTTFHIGLMKRWHNDRFLRVRDAQGRHSLFRLIWGDVICPVSSHLQSFPVCLLWHDLYIVLSTPSPELVFKSRFNLHASCLQEEEVEEFRVSLSWSWYHPVSVWTSRN